MTKCIVGPKDSSLCNSGAIGQTGRMRWLIAVIVALALGWFIGRSSVSSPLESSPEVVFARDMRAHHSQAVDMAVRIRERTTDQDLRFFATDIVLTQQNEVGQMQAWLTLWNLPLTGANPVMNGEGERMGMAKNSQVSSLSRLPIEAAEISFLQLMIRHHQGGVMMAQQVLAQNPRAEVTQLANSIVRGQQYEISLMRNLLKRRGATALPDLEPMKMTMPHN
jgi:uncharacterized protein (DUF305 family)